MTDDRRPAAGISGLPFDDVRAVLQHFPEFDQCTARAAGERLAPLGHIGELASWLVGWRGLDVSLNRLQIDMFISLLNVGREDVDDQQLHLSQDLLANVAGGGHSLSQVALVHGAGLKVYDLALELPTGNILEDAAMDERECAGAMAFGMEGIAGGLDLVGAARAGTGGMIGAAAILLLLFPDMESLILEGRDEREFEQIRKAADVHRAGLNDPFDLLRRLGSRDMAAIAGLIMSARTQTVPVVLAGLESLAVAALLERAGAGNTAHCLAAHRGQGAEAELVRRLGLQVVLNDDAGAVEGLAVAAALGALKTASAAAMPFLRDLKEMGAE